MFYLLDDKCFWKCYESIQVEKQVKCYRNNFIAMWPIEPTLAGFYGFKRMRVFDSPWTGQ